MQNALITRFYQIMLTKNDNGFSIPNNLSDTPNSASALSTAASNVLKFTLAIATTCSSASILLRRVAMPSFICCNMGRFCCMHSALLLSTLWEKNIQNRKCAIRAVCIPFTPTNHRDDWLKFLQSYQCILNDVTKILHLNKRIIIYSRLILFSEQWNININALTWLSQSIFA